MSLISDELKAIVDDAKAAGNQLAQDTQDAAHTILNHIATNVETDLPTLADKTVQNLYQLLPASSRSSFELLLKPVMDRGEQIFTDEAKKIVAEGLGYALNRIDGFLKPFEATPAPAASAPTTTPSA